MLGLGKAGRVRAAVTASAPQCRDIYQRYAASLYRQALLAHHDSVLAEQVVCDVIVNEHALALLPEHGEDDAHYRRQSRSSGAVSSWWLARRSRIAAQGSGRLGVHPGQQSAGDPSA
jgi:hypothetical protein